MIELDRLRRLVEATDVYLAVLDSLPVRDFTVGTEIIRTESLRYQVLALRGQVRDALSVLAGQAEARWRQNAAAAGRADRAGATR